MPDKKAIRIRPVGPGDSARTVEIVGLVFAEYGMTYDPEGWDRDLMEPHFKYAGPHAAFWVAEFDGQVMGMGGAHIDEAGTPEAVAELHRIYIDPKARGLGLGNALCDVVEAWTREQGVRKMILWSDFRFPHAHKMYRGRGYRIFGSRKIEDPDRSCEFGMERDLTQPLAFAPEPLVAGMRERAIEVGIGILRGDPELMHKARFMVAGILDARSIVHAGRMTGPAHELPALSEVFAGRVPEEEVRAIVADHTILGFRAPGVPDAIHPSCAI